MQRFFAGVATAAMLLLVGCGGDDGGGESADTTAEDAAASTTAVPESDPEATDAEPAPSDPEGTDEPGTSGPGGSAQELCTALEPTRDIDPSVLPVPADVALLAAAADAAPTEDLRDDILAIVGYAEQLAELDPGDEDDRDDGVALATDPDLLASVGSLRTYAEDECGFDLPFLGDFDTGGSSGGGGGGPDVDVDVDTRAVRDELEASAPELEANLLGISRVNSVYLASIAGLTVETVVAACDALGAAFVAVDPAYAGVTVQAADDQGEVVAEGEAGSPCALA